MSINPCCSLWPKGEEVKCTDFVDKSCLVSGPACVGGATLIGYGCAVGNPWLWGTATALTAANAVLSAWNSINAPWAQVGRNVNALGTTTKNLGETAQKLSAAESRLEQQGKDFDARLQQAQNAKEAAERALQAQMGRMSAALHEVDGEQKNFETEERRAEGVVAGEETANQQLGSLASREAAADGVFAKEEGQFQKSVGLLSQIVSALGAKGKVEQEERETMSQLLSAITQDGTRIEQENRALQRLVDEIGDAKAIQARADASTQKLVEMESRLQLLLSQREGSDEGEPVSREPFNTSNNARRTVSRVTFAPATRNMN